MRKFLFFTCLLFMCFSNVSQAQNCFGASQIFQARASFTFLRSLNNNRLVAAGVYYSATAPNLIIGNDTLYHRAGDVLTLFSAILDSNLNLVRVFNVIGFSTTGGSFNDTRVWDMHADSTGNIYFSGCFSQDTLISYNNDTIYSDGYQEAFILRCDTMGNTTLLKSFGTRQWGTNYNFEDRAHSITSDANGNIYFTISGEGYYLKVNNDTVNSTSSAGTVNYSDGYVVSLFSNGATRWMRNFGTIGKDDTGYDIAVNNAGEVAVCGAINGSNSVFHFGSIIHTYAYSQYGIQGFIGKLNALGQPVWLSPIEVYTPTGPDVGAYAVAIDNSGYVYGSGYFDAWAKFNGDTIASPYYTSNYFVKYNNSGQRVFLHLGNIDTFYPYPIYLEVKGGKALITGQSYTNQLQFGPYGQCCSAKAYSALYDTSGQIQWLRSARTSGSGNCSFGMGTLNLSGTAFVCGVGSGTVDLSPVNFNTVNGGGFVIKYGAVAGTAPVVNITGNDTMVCGSVNVLQRTISPASGVTTTWWSDNDTILNPNTSTAISATPLQSAMYVVTAFYNGCVTSDTLMVTVLPIPAMAGSDTLICAGQNLTLQGNTITGAQYNWSPSSMVLNDSLPQTAFTGSSNATLIYTVNKGACVNADTLQVNVLQAPQASYSWSGSLLTVQFNSLSLNYDSLIWDFGDLSFDTVENPVHTYTQNGLYNCCLYAYNFCGTDTFCQDINLLTVDNSEVSSANFLNTFVDNNGSLCVYYISEANEQAIIEVNDISGRVVYRSSIKVSKEKNVIELPSLSTGLFCVRMICNGSELNRLFYVSK